MLGTDTAERLTHPKDVTANAKKEMITMFEQICIVGSPEHAPAPMAKFIPLAKESVHPTTRDHE